MKTKANQSAAERNITMVALANIQPSGFNPRKRFDETSLYELAESIKRQGVLQPITVRPVDGTDRYGIVFGERRYRASVIAGRDEIPAIVSELSDEEAEEMAITENLQRKDVTPVEEAAAYQRLIESGRHTVRPVDGTDRYGIVFGERRYRASVIAGRDEIPAIVSELSDEEAEEMAITENLQRKDVTPVEEAAAYQRLIESGRHTVRPVDGTDRYGIVFGERRYRASVIAGRDEIPAIVSELSDEEAEEMAITENLQRKDVTPVEEAAAYQRLIESGRHTVQTLAVLFGKNENYIRTRLKFTALIPEIAALLDADEITISVAAEICRYGEDIQREVYEKHLQDEGTYNSWRGLKAADVARRIEQNFTTDLQYYHFDKAECATCAHNTNNLLLFHDGGCGHCANRTCLAEMNASFLMERAVQIMRNQPEVSLCRDCYTANETVVERLTASGYEVETLDRYTAFPSCPKEPKAENFNDPERYGEARTRYEQQWADYMEQEEEITRRSGAGEITVYAKIGQKEITFCYVENVTETETADGTPAPAPLSPVEKLEKQDKRNKEIALERTVEDTKKQILEADITGGKFSADEDTMLYFFLLSSLRKEHFAAVGIAEDKPYITDEDKMGIIGNLTVKMKTIIRRDFLVANFKGAYGNNTVATLLLDFARRHMPEELANIEREYNGVYEKRHQRIEEKKAVLLVQERARERKVTQPEEQPQPEEIAA